MITGKAGKLYVVATPIGHREDITLRALRVLREVDVVAAEDTRHTRALLAHHGIRRALVSLHEHNEAQRTPELVRKLCRGTNIALVSDAGTPLISDPGFRLVRVAHEHGVEVVPVPGPSSVVAALCVAGLPTDRFVFEGFLPPRSRRREARLIELATQTRTMVFFESTHRIVDSIDAMTRAFGPRREATLATEMTKLFEAVRRDDLEGLGRWLREVPERCKGEFVIVVRGCEPVEDEPLGELERRLVETLVAVLPMRQVAELGATITGRPRNVLYRYALSVASDRDG